MNILKRDQQGFTHHLLLLVMLLFVVGAGVVGARRIYLLHAQVNPTYVVAVQNQQGCILAGRPWNSTNSNCGSSCRNNQGNYTHITGSDGISRGYCTKAIAESISDNLCVNSYHRYYVKQVGCSRRPNQDVNKLNARQCQPAYPKYKATVNPDVCVALAGAEPSIRVASFNILSAKRTVPPDPRYYSIGPYQPRLAEAYKVISGQKFDVVGLQEMELEQRTLFLSNYGANYGIYPTSADYGTDASSVSIIWNKARFSLVSGTLVQYHFKVTDPSVLYSFPVVLLKDLQTGDVIAFGNLHMPPGPDYTAASLRYTDAQIVRNVEQSWVDQGYPVIFTGDYNSQAEIRDSDVVFTGNDRYKVPYCYLGATANMAHTYDLLLNRNTSSGTCPANNLLIKIDQVWANTDSTVRNYNPFYSSDVAGATDHPFVPFADIVPDAAQ